MVSIVSSAADAAAWRAAVLPESVDATLIEIVGCSAEARNAFPHVVTPSEVSTREFFVAFFFARTSLLSLCLFCVRLQRRRVQFMLTRVFFSIVLCFSGSNLFTLIIVRGDARKAYSSILPSFNRLL
jgi:hypothetical protein